MTDFLGCINSTENDCLSITNNGNIPVPVFNQDWFSSNIIQ